MVYDAPGFFTRCFARNQTGRVVGIDPDPAAVEYARLHAAVGETYSTGSGEALPFPSSSFDYTVSVTALCFVRDQFRFMHEMARVAKNRCAVVLLNRRSILWCRKGKDGGQGAYRGAHWHTRREAADLFDAAGLSFVSMKTGLLFPSGSSISRLAEKILPSSLPWGGFLLTSGVKRELLLPR